MKPLRTRLLEARKRHGTPWEILERDYLISWIIAAINEKETLQKTLVLKGGAALRKCYFGEYHFSEDLDFTGLRGAPRGDALLDAIRKSCEAAMRMLDDFASVEIVCERYTEKKPHPGGQEAFILRGKLPWHRQPRASVMIEVSMDEMILRPSQRAKILHDYGEHLDAEIEVYALEEIVAEKLRAILQFAKRIEERGWSRSRARDYYDLWCVLGTFRDRLEFSGFASLLAEKCAARNVSFKGPEDFFQEGILTHIARTWNQWLGPLVQVLPAFETVIAELRPQVRTILE